MKPWTLIALVALAACGDKEARYNKKCGGPWYGNFMDIDTTGEDPVFSWPTEYSPDAEDWWFSVLEVDESAEAVRDEYEWEISGDSLPNPLTYGQTVEGATVDTPPAELRPGARYLAGVFFYVGDHECFSGYGFGIE
jgi:hypothetical protein